MRYLLLTLCASMLAACASASHATLTHVTSPLDEPGPYHHGWSQVAITRPNGTTFTALLFYPATREGQGAPLDTSGGPYPAISFGHGFLQSPNQYRSTLEHLATWGYFAIATESYQNLFPDHALYAIDLSLCLTWLEQRNAEPKSMLFEMVDTGAFGLSGHSMGGGASILAAASDKRIKAVANLAAANTNPSAVAAAASLTMPISLIAGSEDTITPVQNHGQLMYDNVPGPRQLPLIIGGFHCGFTDNTFPFCDSGSISRAEQLAITRRLLTAFFNLHLKGDQTVWQSVWGPTAMADPAVEVTSDPRVSIALHETSLGGPAGSVAQVQVTVTNTGPVAAAYDIFGETAGGALSVEPQATAEIAPGEHLPITLSITIPQEPATAIISVRSQTDGATRGFAALEITPHPKVPGDLNGDGVVDVSDLLILLAAWGPCPQGQPCPADLTGEGAVDVSDLLLLLGNWG